MRRHIPHIGLIMIFMIGPISSSALADDDFTIAGTYTQNVACKGDGTDPKTALVQITENDVNSNFGLCTFLKKIREGKTITAQLSCTGQGGTVILGDVRFTKRDDKTLDFVDQDNTYSAVLYRCPDDRLNTQRAPGTAR